jgi:hypothetical protein
MPVKIAEINDLPLGGRDFHFVEHLNILFVAVSEMKITSRLDSYITNVSCFYRLKTFSYQFTMPWEKKDKADTYATVGAAIIYKVRIMKESDGDTGSWQFQRLWMKGYPLQTGSI